MTSSATTAIHPWPATTLALWAACRNAGACAPDDLLHTLHTIAQVHEIDAAPDTSVVTGSGNDLLALLELMSSTAHVAVRLPVAGDPQGLPPGGIGRAAAHTGEVLLIDDRAPGARGPMPALAVIARGSAERCRWEIRRSPDLIAVDQLSVDLPLGDLEYELTGAVRDAADILATTSGARPAGPTDLRVALAELVSAATIELPPHTGNRVDRVLATAAQIDAIVALVGTDTLGLSGVESDASETTLRQLADLARTARTAAINTAIVDYRR